MECRYEFSPLALLQAEVIHDWIAERSPDRAAKWSRGLVEAIESIRSFPRRCPVAPETARFGEEIRELLYGKRQKTYRIRYAIRGDVIRVFAILHASVDSG